MLKHTMRFAALAGTLALCSTADADPWKDESGHGRGGPPPWAGRGGEPPDWARGKGVWDGHLKHGWGGPPPWAGRGRDFHDRPYGTGFYGYGQPYYGGYGYGSPGIYGGYYVPHQSYRYGYPGYGWWD